MENDFLTNAAKAVQKMEVVVPELSMTVHVWGLTARQISTANKAATKQLPKGRKGVADGVEIDNDTLSAMMLSMSLRDAEGNRLIPEGREAEVHDLPFEIIQRLAKAMNKVCGLSPAEDLEGN